MKTWIPAALLACMMLPLHSLWAQDNGKEKADSTGNGNTFEELIKEAEHAEGFIDTYRKDGHLYFAIPPDMLDKEFLMNYEIARGIGSSGLFGGTMLNIFEADLVALEKHDGKIFLVQKPHRYRADGNDAARKAVELSYGSSVLETADIAATNEDSVMLIDARKWFVSDLSRISQRLKYAVSSTPGQPGNISFDEGRSHLESVKSFPRNTNINARLTFLNNEENAPRTVPDGRYLPVTIHYSMAALPEEPMTPRMADDRLGYFMTVHKDFSEVDDSFFRRYVNRWRLECTDETSGEELCEVKKPITYYIDRTVPKEYRAAMIDGVEAWSDAFEEAGFRDAVRAVMLPDDADPEDIRYATLRWNTSDEPGYGAIGPSVVDPRTGEILDADILFEAGMVMGFKNTWRNLVDPATAIDQVLGFDQHELSNLQNGGELSNLGAHFSDQGSLLRVSLIARGEITAGQPVPEEYVHEALKWVTMHEVGHTLGLRHNFRSSIDTPVDLLHDKEWAEENGVFSSVMEYPTPNISSDGEENGYYYNPGVGSYDRWVVAYGYTPDEERAGELARQSAEEGHAYGTDEDARGAGALDPTVNVFDLGDDPLAWGRGRAELVRSIMPRLPDYVLEDNEPYYELTEAYLTLLGQYAQALSTGVKYIGGQYQYRDHRGDPNGRAPFVPVELKRQQEALDYLIEYGFSEEAFELAPELYQQFGANRWSHWGNENTFSGRIDYPLHTTILEIQTGLLNQLTDPHRLSRIRDTEIKFGAENVVGLPELMGRLSEAVWAEAWESAVNTTSMRRDLQRAHLDRMITLLTDAPEGTPSDARSVVRMQMQDLNDRLEERLSSRPDDFDGYTRAHLEESQARVEAALRAGLELKN